MAVHNLRLTVATVDPNGDPVDLQARKEEAQNWVDNHQELLKPLSSTFITGNTDPEGGTGSDYARGSWRFAWDEDPVAMKDEIGSWLQNHFQWWAVAYHQCDHDEDAGERPGCSWDHEWTSSDPAPPASVVELG